MIGLDSTKQVYLLLIQQMQSSWIFLNKNKNATSLHMFGASISPIVVISFTDQSTGGTVRAQTIQTVAFRKGDYLTSSTRCYLD